MTLLIDPPLTDTQQYLLRILFEEGGLTTGLLGSCAMRERRRVLRALERLREQGLITSQPVGAAGEHCWWLTYAGARALGHAVGHGEARYRAPSSTQLAQKAEVILLLNHLQMLGWEYLRPVVYNPGHPKPDDTPQRLAIYRAVEAHFQRTPPSTAAPRLHPSNVPVGLNDWVAWPPGEPERALVLILHPVGGTPHFWRTRAHRVGGRAVGSPGRTQLYADVARIVPVIGLFATRELVADYTPLLRPAHLHAWYQDQLLIGLHNYRFRNPPPAPARP